MANEGYYYLVIITCGHSGICYENVTSFQWPIIIVLHQTPFPFLVHSMLKSAHTVFKVSDIGLLFMPSYNFLCFVTSRATPDLLIKPFLLFIYFHGAGTHVIFDLSC